MQNIQDKIGNIITLVPPVHANFRKEVINESGSRCCADILNFVNGQHFDRNEIISVFSFKTNMGYAEYKF